MDPLCLPESVKQTRRFPPQVVALTSWSDTQGGDKHGAIFWHVYEAHTYQFTGASVLYRQPREAPAQKNAGKGGIVSIT